MIPDLCLLNNTSDIVQEDVRLQVDVVPRHTID